MYVTHHGLNGERTDQRASDEANAERYPPLVSALIVIVLSCVLWAIILTPVFWLLS
jgi:hypothetical protein